MGDTIQYSIYKQLINDWARARNNEKGPVGIKKSPQA